jgi:pilus assembly protein CpaC
MKKYFLVLFLLTISLALFPFKDYASEEVAEELRVYLGEVKVIPVMNPTRIAIGSPNIADVTNVTKREITLNPKAAGTTTLVLWDSFGEHSFRVKVFVEDMQEIKRRIDNLIGKLDLPEVYTQAEDEEGKVVLLGRVKIPQDRERIFTALGPLKDKTVDLIQVKEEETVVEIDVQVLELNKDATTTLGFSWPGSITATEVGSPALPQTSAISITEGTTPSASYTLTPQGARMGSFFRVSKLTRSAFIFSLDALVQEGKARILSRPRLACQSGKEAELLVGGEKPTFATFTTQVSTGVTIEYKEYGIKLKIKPTVMEENRMKLGLNVQVSEVGEAETIGSTTEITAKAYPITKRDVSTELFINDGQTLAIGGLIKQKTDEELRKTPWLGDIPVLGLFFRKKTTRGGGGAGTRGDTELFITLTPTIIAREQEKPRKEEAKKEGVVSRLSPAELSNVPAYMKGYAAIVQKRILDNLTYPASAKEAGFQGTVKLGLHLSYRGELLEATVKSSSGYKILDDHALAVAKGIASYPPFPSSIEQKEFWIDIPVSFRLD